MAEKSFKKETMLKKEAQVQELLGNMPGFVRKYMDFIHLSTAASSRLEYLRDISAFMNYIADGYSVPVNEITTEIMDELTADYINSYLNYLSMYEKDGKVMSNENVSIRRKLSSLRGLYNYLFEQDMIIHNPIVKVKRPKVPKREVIRMDEEETKQFIDTIKYGTKLTPKERDYFDRYGYRDFTLLSLMLGTGIRVSEAVGLNITDVDLRNNKIRVIRKGSKEEVVYFSDDVGDILNDYIEMYRNKIEAVPGDENALFLSIQRRRITTRGVQYMVKKYVGHTELLKHITPHKFRSTFGTKLYEESGDLYLVASVLGHQSVDTSQIYVTQTDKRKSENRNRVQW